MAIRGSYEAALRKGVTTALTSVQTDNKIRVVLKCYVGTMFSLLVFASGEDGGNYIIKHVD